MANFGLPYRPPCGGWPSSPARYFGGCYQHTRAAEQHIQHYDNVTTLVATGARPDTVVPKADNWHPEDFNTCAGGDVTVDLNCYRLHEGLFDDLSRCRKLGAKWVQAAVVWHGRFGWLSHDPSGCKVASVRLPAVGEGCGYEELQAAPDGTKYLVLTANASWEEQDYDPTGTNGDGTKIYPATPDTDNTAHDNRVVTIGKHSGVKVETQDAANPGGGDNPATPLLDMTTTMSCCHLMDLFDADYGTMSDIRDTDPTHITLTTTGSGLAVSATLSGQVSLGGGSYSAPFTWRTVEVDVDGGTFHYKEYNTTPGYVALGTLMVQIDITLTDTVFSYYDWATTLSGTRKIITINTLTGTLSSTYTGAQAYADLVALLDYWDLTDDKTHPWRTDNYVTIAPLVTYWGYPLPRQPTVENPPYQDPNAYGLTDAGTGAQVGAWYDGSVIGKPNPAGYSGHFDWHLVDFVDKVTCTADEGSSWGAYPPASIPANSTHWTAQCAAWALPPGAYISYGPCYGADGVTRVGPGNVLYAQKLAEIKIHRPAMDFARPYGVDRFTCVSSTCGCVSSYDSGSRTVTLLAAVSGISTGDLCLVNGGDAPAGVYPVTVVDGSHYVLGALKWTLSDDVPVGIEFGKIRWPAAWSIAGRAGVASAAAAGGTVTVTLAAPAKYLRTGDAVDFTDGSGAVTEANKTVTVVDETHFTYAGASAPTGTYVKSHGAPGYWWFDSDSKGDYLLFQWQHDYRDIGEADRMCAQYANMEANDCSPFTPEDPGGCNGDPSTGAALRRLQDSRGMPRSVKTFTVTEACLSFTPCWPQVVCISPNGEEFEHGTTYPFPDFTLDERYGALWQAVVEFVMPDPLWEAPPEPCSEHFSWNEDQGNCTGDYAHRPMVEARQSIPTVWIGGDAQPGISDDELTHDASYTDMIHVLTLAELASGSPPKGVVVPPPQPVGSALNPETQWSLWLLEVDCVCNDTKPDFAAEYKANGVSVNCPSP